MTDYAALRHEATQFFADNASAVFSNKGAAFPESKILFALAGVESTGGRSLLGYAYQCALLRGVPQVENRAEAYYLTHIIFFATDFGKRVLDGMPMSDYCAALDALVVTYADDLDVLGELVMSAKCIGHWSEVMDAALAKFVEGWSALDRGDFDNNYHPILVGGLLFAKLSE